MIRIFTLLNVIFLMIESYLFFKFLFDITNILNNFVKFSFIKLKFKIFLINKSTNPYSSSSKAIDNNSENISQLNPNWITGFTDAEGCFSIGISIKDSLK